jgi:hypothetical protein
MYIDTSDRHFFTSRSAYNVLIPYEFWDSTVINMHITLSPECDTVQFGRQVENFGGIYCLQFQDSNVLYPEDGGSKFPREFGKYPPNYMALDLTRASSS